MNMERENGFTLVELLISIVIVTTLLAMGVPVQRSGAKPIQEEDVIWADLILVMESGFAGITITNGI